MTDGCAFVLRRILDSKSPPLDPQVMARVQETYAHLTSRDPDYFWTSGQWMTEKKGGSDVSASTETIAIFDSSKNVYRLFGYKWFSSATDCQVALALARIVGQDHSLKFEDLQKTPPSLFLMRVKQDDGTLNQIEIIRLKDKLGTRQLPTAELVLNGSEAYLISEPQKGIKAISDMLNITRVYNATTAVANMRRIIALCRDYSDRRSAFGKKLNELPLQVKTLFDMEIRFRANFLFLMKVTQWMNEAKVAKNTDSSKLFRMSTSLLKLFTGKESLAVVSEGIEFIGGVGYMENSNLPTLLRDCQVLTIWEGTTNVLSLDFARSVKNGDLEAYWRYFTQILSNCSTMEHQLASFTKYREIYLQLHLAYTNIRRDLTQLLKKQLNHELTEFTLREISISFTKIATCFIILEIFLKTGDNEDLNLLLGWAHLKQPLYNVISQLDVDSMKDIALHRDILGKNGGIGDLDERGVVRSKF